MGCYTDRYNYLLGLKNMRRSVIILSLVLAVASCSSGSG
ncbi:MAG: lipoprotein [Verrucomicrobia bacterium]|nr:lipoprotein [Verrucomicrobiota bacterium]MCF7709332.1 lipoprotein [Verrucomicrobiota bacterium]